MIILLIKINVSIQYGHAKSGRVIRNRPSYVSMTTVPLKNGRGLISRQHKCRFRDLSKVVFLFLLFICLHETIAANGFSLFE